MTNDPFKGMRIVGDSAHPKAIDPMTKSWQPKPGSTAQPKAPLAPTETGQKSPPPPAKHD
jgi:hypothetical protein